MPCCVTDINFVTVNGVMMGLKRQKKITYVNFVLQVVVNFMTACKLKLSCNFCDKYNRSGLIRLNI